MVSSRQAISCILLIFSAFIYARSQGAAEKALTSTITGKVTVKGKGVPGIGVSLTMIDTTSHPSAMRHRGVTDDEGNYRLTNVPPGNYVVMIGAPGYATVDRSVSQKTVIVSKGETVENVDFSLVRGGVVTGKVTDSDGRPLIEEDVFLLPASLETRQLYYRMANGRTDDRGIYRIFGVYPGNYKVAAGQDESDGFGGMRGRALYKRTYYPDAAEASGATVIEVKEGGEVTNVDITVGRSISKYFASGRIVDGETGRPLADVPYGVQMFVDANNSSSMTNGAASNSEGEFKLHNLAPGKYAVFIEPPANSDWRADAVHFEVTDQNVTGLTIKTVKGASASGVIVLEGTNDKALYAKFIKGQLYAHVMSDQPDRSSSPSTKINPDGSFRIGGLQPGVLYFGFYPSDNFKIARIERDGLAYPRGVEIKESEQLTGLRLVVSYANGIIRGVVKLEKGTPPPDAQFNLSLRKLGESDGPFPSNYIEPPPIDARGQFVAAGLLPGTYEVTVAYAPNLNTPWRRATQQVVVSNGAAANITLTIDPDAPVPSRP